MKNRRFNESFGGKNEAKRRKLELHAGSRGVFVTPSLATNSRDAMREFLVILSRFMKEREEAGDGPEATESQETTAPPPAANPPSTDAESAASALSDAVQEPADCDVMQKAVSDEIKEIEAESRRFVPKHDIYKGVSFVSFTNAADVPSHIVREILMATKDRKAFYAKYICKLMPVDFSCKPHLAEFQKLAREVVAKHLPLSAAALSAAAEQSPDNAQEAVVQSSTAPPDSSSSSSTVNETRAGSTDQKNEAMCSTSGNNKAETAASEGDTNGEAQKKRTWCVEFHSRSKMDTMPRQEVIDTLTAAVGDQHYKVNLTDPELTLMVDVSPLICGFTILNDFAPLRRYNFHRLSHPEEEVEIERMREAQLAKGRISKETSAQEDVSSAKKGAPANQAKPVAVAGGGASSSSVSDEFSNGTHDGHTTETEPTMPTAPLPATATAAAN